MGLVYVVLLVSHTAWDPITIKRFPVFLFQEPIVTCFAIYIALIYAVLYSYLIAYPIVFQEHRGWSAIQTGLAFLSIG